MCFFQEMQCPASTEPSSVRPYPAAWASEWASVSPDRSHHTAARFRGDPLGQPLRLTPRATEREYWPPRLSRHRWAFATLKGSGSLRHHSQATVWAGQLIDFQQEGNTHEEVLWSRYLCDYCSRPSPSRHRRRSPKPRAMPTGLTPKAITRRPTRRSMQLTPRRVGPTPRAQRFTPTPTSPTRWTFSG